MKKILLLALALGALAACESAPVEDPVVDETPEPVLEEEEEENDALSYVNEEYGFSIELTEAWEGYMVTPRELEWGDNGVSDSFDFGLEEGESLFNISIFEKDQWEALVDEESLRPSFLGENENYVFGGSGSHDASIEHQKAREDVEAILETFEVL